MKVERVVVENVHAMPKQGVSSTFRFGVAVGIIHGVAGALRLPLTLVTPTQWKKFHGLPSDKEAARELAIQEVAATQPASRPQKRQRPCRSPADGGLVLRPLRRPP